jgi:O-antigen/teichoic acid export membrane protein
MTEASEADEKQEASPPGRASEERASYLKIFKSTSIIGGANAAKILIGIGSTKVVAFVLGPAGIGLLGLLNSLMAAAVTVAQMGISMAGTRQIAEANRTGDLARIALARRALLIASFGLSALGGGAVWLLREPLAVHVLQNADMVDAVGWVAIGVALSVGGVAQAALLQGMRRIKELALLQIGGAILLAALGLPLVWAFGEASIPFFVVLTPLSSFALGLILVARLEKLPKTSLVVSELAAQWSVFFKLGLPIMGSGIAGTVAALWIQAYIKAELGLESLGQYVASNLVAVQYVGVALAAMASDYYPRLTAVIQDRAAAQQVINQQTEISLLLAGPLMLAMFVLSPWVIHLLFSADFTPAAEILRWQIAGAMLKVIAFPLIYILLAAGAGLKYFVAETVTLIVLAVVSALLVNQLGLVGAGIGYFVAHLAYLLLLLAIAGPLVGLRWSKAALRALAVLGVGFGAAVGAAATTHLMAVVVGVAIAGATSLYLTSKAARLIGVFPKTGKSN